MEMRAGRVVLAVKSPLANAGDIRENTVMHEAHSMYLGNATFVF